jgi:hypothetical protein
VTTPIDPFRPQPRGALNDYLGTLADDVRNVDLRDRVHAASRRVTIRRRIAVTAAAAAAVVAVASGIAVAGLPSAQRDRAPAVDIAPASPDPVRSGSEVAWTKIPPTLYYQVSHPVGDGFRYDLWWWAGAETGLQFQPPGPACGMFPSPDQTRVAWVAVGDRPGATGDLYVAGTDGNSQTRLLYDVTCSGQDVPVWLDSDTLLVGPGENQPRRVVDVLTGKTVDSSFPAGVAGPVVSPNGQYAAWSENGKIVVARPDGTVVARIAHGDETPTGGFTVQGISDDGRRAVLGMRPSDPSAVRTGFRLVDTVTGENVDLPRGVRVTKPLSTEIYPAPGNQLVVRVDEGKQNRIYLLGGDGKILDTRTEPAALHDALLLAPTDL